MVWATERQAVGPTGRGRESLAINQHGTMMWRKLQERKRTDYAESRMQRHGCESSSAGGCMPGPTRMRGKLSL